MIDENKLIGELRSLIDSGELAGYSPGAVIYDICERIWAQPKVGEWVPTTERLPSEEDFIKAYCRNAHAAEFVVMIEGASKPTTLYYTKAGDWTDGVERYKVTAWMPLPEVYQGKGNEK